jgi:hypothetical protein
MARRDTVMVSRTLYQIGVLTLIAAVVGVAVTLYASINKSLVVEVDAKTLAPITPNLDQTTIEAMANRLKLEQLIAQMGEASASGTQNATIEEVVEDEEIR